MQVSCRHLIISNYSSLGLLSTIYNQRQHATHHSAIIDINRLTGPLALRPGIQARAYRSSKPVLQNQERRGGRGSFTEPILCIDEHLESVGA